MSLFIMSQVGILAVFSASCQLCHFKSEPSMAECHARMARELIAEKKEEGNVKNLNQVVHQLKGKIKSKETVKTLNHSK